jgi:acyl carrier protein
MFDVVAEPRVRQIVADELGVTAEELTADVSLTDDLAADSLDLLELTLTLESELGVTISESALDDVRTFGDLVHAVDAAAREGRRAETRTEQVVPTLVWARVVPARGSSAGVQRTGWLTPYTAETIAEDALRAGRGSRLEVAVPATLSDAGLAELQNEFAWLGRRGVQVNVRRDQHLGPIAQRARPTAAA